jgi:DNA-binding transcriptional ArsR family regulator
MATTLGTDALVLIAERFRALGDAARLQILDALRDGEHTVTELADKTGLAQANLSKHLHRLHGVGLVARRKAGLYVHYSIADQRVFGLCDLMCDQLRAEGRERARALQPLYS